MRKLSLTRRCPAAFALPGRKLSIRPPLHATPIGNTRAEMAGDDSAPGEGLDQAEFRKRVMGNMQSSGVVGQVKVRCGSPRGGGGGRRAADPSLPPHPQSQLRAQLLSQLQKGQIVQLSPPPGDRPGLKRHALNSMIADYFGTVNYAYSLSVFKEESGVESRPILTEDEIWDVLKLDQETSFYQAYLKAKAHGAQQAGAGRTQAVTDSSLVPKTRLGSPAGGANSCVLVNLLSAIADAAAAKGKESFTQTIGGDRCGPRRLPLRRPPLLQQRTAPMPTIIYAAMGRCACKGCASAPSRDEAAARVRGEPARCPHRRPAQVPAGGPNEAARGRVSGEPGAGSPTFDRHTGWRARVHRRT